MSEITKEVLIEIASKLAQELNDLIAEGFIPEEKAEVTQQLIDEWEGIYEQADLPWQLAIARDSKEK